MVGGLTKINDLKPNARPGVLREEGLESHLFFVDGWVGGWVRGGEGGLNELLWGGWVGGWVGTYLYLLDIRRVFDQPPPHRTPVYVSIHREGGPPKGLAHDDRCCLVSYSWERLQFLEGTGDLGRWVGGWVGGWVDGWGEGMSCCCCIVHR